MRISFTKIDGFVKIHDGSKYLVLPGSEKYDAVYDRIKYLESEITYIFSYIYFAKIKVDSLPKRKILTSNILNKVKNHSSK